MKPKEETLRQLAKSHFDNVFGMSGEWRDTALAYSPPESEEFHVSFMVGDVWGLAGVSENCPKTQDACFQEFKRLIATQGWKATERWAGLDQ